MEVFDQIVENIPTLFISLVIAFFTARISLRGFYRKESWRRKEKQYSDIINKLCILQKYNNDIYEYEIIGRYIEGKGISSDDIQKKVMRDIEILSYSPSFVINKRVSLELKQLIKVSKEDYNTLFDNADTMYGTVDYVLNEVNKYAKKELNVK